MLAAAKPLAQGRALALVALHQQHLQAGVPGVGDARQDVARTIGRAVVDDDDFVGQAYVQHALQGLLDAAALVVAGDDHRQREPLFGVRRHRSGLLCPARRQL